jgi:transposase-like protein
MWRASRCMARWKSATPGLAGRSRGFEGSRQLKGRHAVPVLVAVERRGERSGRVRMTVLRNFTAAIITALIKQQIAPGSTVYTDGLGSFSGLEQAGFDHVPLKQPLRRTFRTGAKSVVPLADRAIGNLQQWLIGTYHGVSRAQLQAYLDEFVFRHNRRQQPMAAFQTLLGLGTGRTPTPYRRIRGGRDMLKEG